MDRLVQPSTGRWLWHGMLPLCMLVLMLALPVPAHAADVRNEDIVVIGADEVINDELIVLADQFTLQGTINGGLYVMANTIIIDGTVNGAMNVVGRQVIINGTVQRGRIGGQEIVLTTGSRIPGNVMIGGLSLMQQAGSQINGRLTFAGGSAILAGQVGVPAADSTLGMVQPVRFIALTTDLSEAQFASPTMRATRQQTAEERQAAINTGFMQMLRWFASLLIIGLLITWLTPDLLRGATSQLRQHRLPSLLWGVVALPALVVFVLTFILALVLLIMSFSALGLRDMVTLTIIFGSMALIALITGIVILLTYVGNIIIGYLLGELLLQRSETTWARHRIAPLVLGILVISVLSSIPGLGFVVRLAATLLGLGALWLLWRGRQSQQAVPVVAVAGAG